jgi:hypothetical protein
MEERLNASTPVAGTKLIAGLFFTVIGVLLTADNLDLFNAGAILRYWPAVIVFAGLVQVARPGRRVVGVILTVIGASLLAHSAGWLRVTIFDLWPLLLILAGAVMVARALGVRAPLEGARDERDILAILGVQKVASTSPDFAGGRVAAFMGGVEFDLTGAGITKSPAVIEVFVMWGGVEIYVPDGWEVIGEVVPVMGGFEVKTGAAANPQQRLIVRGMALMGGIEVKRRKS